MKINNVYINSANKTLKMIKIFVQQSNLDLYYMNFKHLVYLLVLEKILEIRFL